MRPPSEAGIPGAQRAEDKERIGNGLPEHVVLITDGHRRWSEEHGKSYAEGYEAGALRIAEVADEARRIGIKFLSFWVLSPDNVERRDPDQLALWYRAIRAKLLYAAVPDLIKNGVRVKRLGRVDRENIPGDLFDDFERMEEESRNNLEMTLSFAFNYGGEAELEDAFSSMRDAGEAYPTLTTLKKHLYTAKAGLPDPDWIVRPSGDYRTSGHMPIQSMYANYDYPGIKWPDFTADQFRESIARFGRRRRTFGGDQET